MLICIFQTERLGVGTWKLQYCLVLCQFKESWNRAGGVSWILAHCPFLFFLSPLHLHSVNVKLHVVSASFFTKASLCRSNTVAEIWTQNKRHLIHSKVLYIIYFPKKQTNKTFLFLNLLSTYCVELLFFPPLCPGISFLIARVSWCDPAQCRVALCLCHCLLVMIID